MSRVVRFSDPVSATARWIAAARARESRRPDRLFDDPWAETLAGPEGFALMQRMEAATTAPGGVSLGDNPYLAIRTRFFDDFLKVAVAEAGTPREQTAVPAAALRQIVVLAAGLDTRAFRISWPAGTSWYELDHGDVLGAKDEVLKAAGAVARCERRTVAADLATRGWLDALVASGFDPGAPSAWVVEGLFPYLDETGVRGVLARCGALAASRSRLVTDIVGQGFFESAWTRPYLQALEREHVPWKFGTHEPEALLAAVGWDAAAVRPGDGGASYGRWPYPVAPRNVPGVPSSFFVTATKR